jgi:hypothetical protein
LLLLDYSSRLYEHFFRIVNVHKEYDCKRTWREFLGFMRFSTTVLFQYVKIPLAHHTNEQREDLFFTQQHYMFKRRQLDLIA